MAKVTIEVELNDSKNIACLYTLARLFEFEEKETHLEVEAEFLPNASFWYRHLPEALWQVMEILEWQFEGLSDDTLMQVFADDRWPHAISWLHQEARDLAKLHSYAQAEIERTKAEYQARAVDAKK